MTPLLVVFYLHWLTMILVGLAGLSLVLRPFLLARLYIIGFLGQQLYLNGCIMTAWENKVRVDMGSVPRHQEFIMRHIFKNPMIVGMFKALFVVIILTQIYEIYLNRKAKRGAQGVSGYKKLRRYGSSGTARA